MIELRALPPRLPPRRWSQLPEPDLLVAPGEIEPERPLLALGLVAGLLFAVFAWSFWHDLETQTGDPGDGETFADTRF